MYAGAQECIYTVVALDAGRVGVAICALGTDVHAGRDAGVHKSHRLRVHRLCGQLHTAECKAVIQVQGCLSRICAHCVHILAGMQQL
eukprot:1162147-Pelagomonas_calceolata.AAC.11